MEVNDENNVDVAGVEDYLIFDLYKVFVGDDLEIIRRNLSDEDNQCEKIVYFLFCSFLVFELILIVFLFLDLNIIIFVIRSNEILISDNQVNFRGNREFFSYVIILEKICDFCVVNLLVVNLLVVIRIRIDFSLERSGVFFIFGIFFG